MGGVRISSLLVVLALVVGGCSGGDDTAAPEEAAPEEAVPADERADGVPEDAAVAVDEASCAEVATVFDVVPLGPGILEQPADLLLERTAYVHDLASRAPSEIRAAVIGFAASYADLVDVVIRLQEQREAGDEDGATLDEFDEVVGLIEEEGHVGEIESWTAEHCPAAGEG